MKIREIEMKALIERDQEAKIVRLLKDLFGEATDSGVRCDYYLSNVLEQEIRLSLTMRKDVPMVIEQTFKLRRNDGDLEINDEYTIVTKDWIEDVGRFWGALGYRASDSKIKQYTMYENRFFHAYYTQVAGQTYLEVEYHGEDMENAKNILQDFFAIFGLDQFENKRYVDIMDAGNISG